MKVIFRLSLQKNGMKKRIWAFFPAGCSQLRVGSFLWGGLRMVMLCKHRGLLILVSVEGWKCWLCSWQSLPGTTWWSQFSQKSPFFPPLAAWCDSPGVHVWVKKVLRQFGRRKVNCGLLNIEVLFSRSQTPWSCQEVAWEQGVWLARGLLSRLGDWGIFQALSSPWEVPS